MYDRQRAATATLESRAFQLNFKLNSSYVTEIEGFCQSTEWIFDLGITCKSHTRMQEQQLFGTTINGRTGVSR